MMIQSMKSMVSFAENYSLRQMKGFTANNDIPREVLMMENILYHDYIYFQNKSTIVNGPDVAATTSN